jgi:TonB family protein
MPKVDVRGRAMSRPLIELGCALSLCVAAGVARPQSGDPAPAKEISAEAQAVAKTVAHGDKAHPFIIYADEYPQDSLYRREQGTCAVRVEVDVDGVIRAKQLVVSTGFDRLDAACLAAFSDPRLKDFHLIPATAGGKPVASWIVFAIGWSARTSNDPFFPKTKVNDDRLEVPFVLADFDLKVGSKSYPPEALSLHQEGDCTVRAVVRHPGAPDAVALVRSTGSSSLDEACVAVMSQAPFVPGKPKHGPATNVVDITISWRLPAE